MSAPQFQLHLPLELKPEPTLAEYLPGPNAEAVEAVSAMVASQDGEPYLYLFGGRATGKTHLLQAACLASVQRGAQARFVPLGLRGLKPSLLEDLEHADLVAVDDIQCVAGAPDWELGLFNLFNRLREQGRRLLAAASVAPDALGLGLADLTSRLLWGPRYCLLPLSDGECEQLLLDCARRRGLRLSEDLVRYIMTYHARDPASLLDLLARLDSLSLREQRQPTIPLIRRVMQERTP